MQRAKSPRTQTATVTVGLLLAAAAAALFAYSLKLLNPVGFWTYVVVITAVGLGMLAILTLVVARHRKLRDIRKDAVGGLPDFLVNLIWW